MEFRILSTLSLPGIERTAPGLIHTIVSDTDGNLYYSDEINHQVVSTDPKGQLRWHRGGKGSHEGQFHYPKGLALGYVSQAGRRTACVAVCDSWNRRIQVIGLNGDMLAVWCGSDNEFHEVVDIRFLASGLDTMTGPNTWLILDRGAHRVRLHADTGEPLGGIGNALPSNLELSWAQKLIASIPDAALEGTAADLRFDPVYYPARLFGDTPDALILWEPLARQLKQIVGRNLLPLGRFPDHPWECVDADRTGYLCWAKADSRVAAFGHNGKVERIEDRPGHPVSTASAEGEVWFQDGSTIVRLKWHDAAESVRAKGSRSPLYENVVQELQQLQTKGGLQEATSQLLQAIDRALGQCRDLWHSLCNHHAEIRNAESQKAEIVDARQAVCHAADRWEHCLSTHSLTFLKILCLPQTVAQREDRIPEMTAGWRSLLDSLNRTISQSQELRNSICISRLDPCSPCHRASQELLQFLEDNVEEIFQRVAADIQTAGRYLSLPFPAQQRERAGPEPPHPRSDI